MKKRVLVTGGAGFIGSHLVDKLIDEMGLNVTIFDILEEQVHGKEKERKIPNYLNENAHFIQGSVTNYQKLKDLVLNHDIVFHLAAMVGVGQSMYQIQKYVEHNILGTSNLSIRYNCQL